MHGATNGRRVTHNLPYIVYAESHGLVSAESAQINRSPAIIQERMSISAVNPTITNDLTGIVDPLCGGAVREKGRRVNIRHPAVAVEKRVAHAGAEPVITDNLAGAVDCLGKGRIRSPQRAETDRVPIAV